MGDRPELSPLSVILKRYYFAIEDFAVEDVEDSCQVQP